MSGQNRIKSGALHGSVLAQVIFLFYMKDRVEGVNSYNCLFAGYARVMRRVVEEAVCRGLQED